MVERHRVSKKSTDRGQEVFGNSNQSYMQLKEGKSVIRILPPWSAKGEIFRPVGFHCLPGGYEGKFICPEFSFSKKDAGYFDCPVCEEARKKMKKYGKTVSKMYLPRKRAFLNVLDMQKKDGQVLILDAPQSVLTPIINTLCELDEEDQDALVDEHTGQNIVVTRGKEGGFTKYHVTILPRPYDLKVKGGMDLDSIFENIHDLDALVKMPSLEDGEDLVVEFEEYAEKEIRKLRGDVPEVDDDEDAPVKQTKKRSQPEVPEEFEDDDDDVDEKPKKKKTQSVSEKYAVQENSKSDSILDDDDDDLDIPFGE